jgi:hypothetical protein
MADLVRHVVDAEVEEKGSTPDDVAKLMVDQFMQDLFSST